MCAVRDGATRERLCECVEMSMNCSGSQRILKNADNKDAVETFFKTLKAELAWRHTWATRAHVSNALFQYINGFNNTRRKHPAIGGTSPVKFERMSV